MPAKANVSAKRAENKRGVKRTSADMIAGGDDAPTILQPSITSNARATATHVFFWGGILSNWWLESPTFAGAACLKHLLPELDRLSVPHPPHNALSTQVLAAHPFVCGEQWMMAVKAWLFERSSELGDAPVDLEKETGSDKVIGNIRFKALQETVMQPEPPTDDDTTTTTTTASDVNERLLYNGSLYAILRASTPRTQKALGRQVSGFDDAVWTTASTAIVVASCIARAEVDPALRQVYQAATTTRKFVEGSPRDRIWGVGLKWDNPKINNEANWRGQNRLGQCHDKAAKHIRENFRG